MEPQHPAEQLLLEVLGQYVSVFSSKVRRNFDTNFMRLWPGLIELHEQSNQILPGTWDVFPSSW